MMGARELSTTTGNLNPDERKEPNMRRTDNQLATIGAEASARGGHGGRRIPGRVLGALSLSLVAAAAACEGENLFSGDSPELLPRVLSITAPQTVIAGDTISVRVDATAPHGVAQISVSIDGAVSRDTVVEITPPKTQVGQTIRVAVPSVISDTLLTVHASAADALGNVSRARVLELVAFGPPLVSSVSGPASIRGGDVVNLEARVSGSRRVTRVDYAFRGALTKDTSIAVNPAVKSITQALAIQLPATLVQGDTMLQVSVSAVDESGFRGAPRVVEIPLSIDPPVLLLDVPAQARAGDKLEVKVRATGLRKVSQVRVELRGVTPGAYSNTTVAADPLRSDFQQTVTINLPGAVTFDPNTCSANLCALGVHVFAIDIGGAISATKSDTVYIPVDPPVILDVETPGGVFTNAMTPPIRVLAEGDRPLSEITVYFRGAVDAEQTHTVTPQRHEASADFTVLIPETPNDGVLIVYATARDVTGALSEIATRVIAVELPEEDETGSASLSSARTTDVGETLMRLREQLGLPAAGANRAAEAPKKSSPRE